MVEPVPEYICFPKEEEKTLEFWTKHNTFQNSIKQSKGKPRYAFYDGPPFATGLPHYGHILAGTIKDTVTRFAHQSGYHVERRFGWDCHGLPVEYEIDKTLGITGPEDVAKMGVAVYNNECRKIVMRYSGEWERIVSRLGRWIDFKNDYKTLYPWFMESVWWVFKQLYDKGFVYSGFKVMPYSTGCSTPLSNFEASQNYKDVNDPAVIVSFPLDEDPQVKVVAWTTTPWTLPSNLALCVHPDMIYVKVEDKNTNEIYILLEARLVSLYKSEEEYKILDKFPGKNLFGKGYKPLFPYFSHMKSQGAFRVLTDTYVTDESGTGVVHQAPFFGADDYRVCMANEVIKKDGKPICPVDATGRFTEEVSDFKGQYVKDADKNICKFLKESKRLVHQGTTKHSYPFCWRSDTPLLYKAVPSWFVRVEQMTENLLSRNKETYWVPDFVKKKRFANWLKDAHDWAISRNRYWGTPIPLWTSDDMEEVVCVGSIQELEKLSGVKVTDLHRESVDHITIPSRMGKGVLRRIEAVFDCWFESGSMPYAQMHYPFENKKEFEDTFPAHFIAEGIDQTRGWFYTLLVLSTALFGKPPFKNLIVNGLVLAEDGQKMSKRKKNYPDPMTVVNSYGADALRLYLINSPVVRAENLRFKESGVRDILKDVFLPWYNAYRFLVQNILRFEKDEGVKFQHDEDQLAKSTNIMDKWIISCIQSLVSFVKEEMDAYRLYTVVPRLVRFVDLLTNWYVRSNRRRIKGENGVIDCELALQTLFSVLMTLIQIMSPFTPYLTEHIYQNLKRLMPGDNSKEDASIHYLMLPEVKTKLVNVQIEKAVSRMQTVIELGRVIRDRKTLPNKYPLQEVVIIHKSNEYLDDVKSLEKYVMEELNVRKITLSGDKDRYGITLKAQPDHVLLGKRLKGAFKQVSTAIQKLTVEQIEGFIETGSIEVCGHKLEQGELRLIYQFETLPGVPAKYEAHSDNDVMVLLDVTPDQTLLDEGIAREIVNRIQKLRKKAKLVPTDDVTVYYDASTSPNLQKIATSHSDFIQSLIRSPLLPYPVSPFADVIIEDTTTMKQEVMGLTLVRGHSDGNELIEGKPFCRYTNVEIVMNGRSSCHLSVLLENPRSNPVVTDYRQFTSVISRAFFDGCPMTMVNDVNINFNAMNGSYIIAEVTKKKTVSSVEGIFSDSSRAFVSLTFDEENVSLDIPASPFVNVVYIRNSTQGPPALGTVLLENPPMCNRLDISRLQRECSKLFGIGKGISLYSDKNCTTQLSTTSDLVGQTVYCKATE